MARSHSSFKEIGSVLETDQAIAARVLKLANSAYYGLSGMVSSIQHAAVVLGHEKLGEIITLAGTSNFLGKKLKGYGMGAGDLWRHSLAVAYGSKIIAGRRNPKLANDAFSAGLFHDAGKIILDPYLFENKEVFHEQIKNHQKTLQSAEKKILGFDHAEIASEFCMKWNIPESLSIAIKYHHEPCLSQENELSYILNMANSIAIMTGIGANIDDTLQNQIDKKTMEFLNLQDEDVDHIKIEVYELIEKIVNEIHPD
ncbi:MAG: HDOD domain-containing protein [Desulfobacterales bacterium]|nr:HDOD domain-containing protein [Desulfobacterales bacterium]